MQDATGHEGQTGHEGNPGQAAHTGAPGSISPPPANHQPLPVGIGWHQPHYRGLMERRPDLAFVEVHAENFFAAGGAAPALLQSARAQYGISLHAVGLGLGSAAGVDPWHLEQLARLVEQVQPLLVSDHACFARVNEPVALHGIDLLPIAFTPAALDILARNVQQVQERLSRPLLVENLAQYIRWTDDCMDEPDFFNRLVRRTGCGLLLDLNNLVVNALNAGAGTEAAVAAACAHVDRLDARAVGEIHLAGYHDAGGIVIDDHGSRVHAPVWQVFRHTLRRTGAVPVLVEWDTRLPTLDVLLEEAALARSCMQQERLGARR